MSSQRHGRNYNLEYEQEAEFWRDEGFSLYVSNDSVGSKWIVKRPRAGTQRYQEQVQSRLFCEAALLLKLQHPNLCLLKDAPIEHEEVMLVLEPCEPFSAWGLQQKQGMFGLQLADVKCFMYQLVSAIAFLHQHNVGHMRLRPACCFFSQDGILKLGCLDSARVIAKGTFLTSSIPSVAAMPADSALPYCAPEILLHADQSLSADVWSIGCIFAELVTGAPLFEGKSSTAVLRNIIKLMGLCPNHLKVLKETTNHDFQDLEASAYSLEDSLLKKKFANMDSAAARFLDKCLSQDPWKRTTASALLETDFLRSTPDSIRNLMAKENERILKTWTPNEKQRVAAAVAQVAKYLSCAGSEPEDNKGDRQQLPTNNQLPMHSPFMGSESSPLRLRQAQGQQGSIPLNFEVAGVTGLDRISELKAGAEMRKSMAVDLETVLGQRVEVNSDKASLNRVSNWLSSIPTVLGPDLDLDAPSYDDELPVAVSPQLAGLAEKQGKRAVVVGEAASTDMSNDTLRGNQGSPLKIRSPLRVDEVKGELGVLQLPPIHPSGHANVGNQRSGMTGAPPPQKVSQQQQGPLGLASTAISHGNSSSYAPQYGTSLRRTVLGSGCGGVSGQGNNNAPSVAPSISSPINNPSTSNEPLRNSPAAATTSNDSRVSRSMSLRYVPSKPAPTHAPQKQSMGAMSSPISETTAGYMSAAHTNGPNPAAMPNLMTMASLHQGNRFSSLFPLAASHVTCSLEEGSAHAKKA
ncbi:hypothetical protein CEUSTIGMA_g10275.t1 [Chlamydomonas eustigma]|uniref:Protein kinase domain-containing protein n=1 Tax=Chlamydomonas eustigma TaxID=1157962 RepID=A0A250XIV3_9CHLO|nr:hypothetical protein CEUSTIGMA_g10275.t1 [Chlamydomonas eustigma]|eukprot:GAX82849.1 hypothetical protein CEUSTIGMA_g10275.t1 [Chlamydomonas eustigma]